MYRATECGRKRKRQGFKKKRLKMITTIAAPSMWIFFEWNRTLSMTLAKSNSVKFKMNTRNFYDCTKHSFILFRFLAFSFFSLLASEQTSKRWMAISVVISAYFRFVTFICGILRFYALSGAEFFYIFFFVLARGKKIAIFFLVDPRHFLIFLSLAIFQWMYINMSAIQRTNARNIQPKWKMNGK